MAQSGVDLSIIVPAYNEADRLPETLRRFQQYLSAKPFSYEILVVLDGPTDGTREILKGLEAEIRALRSLHREANRGKGYTVREGMLQALGHVRLFADADIPRTSPILTSSSPCSTTVMTLSFAPATQEML